MCIIVEKTATTVVSKAWFNEFWVSNPDGFGVVVHNPLLPFGERLSVQKTLDRKEAWTILNNLNSSRTEAIVHFRQATHGDVNLDMCHPFIIETKYSGDVVVTHNGMLTSYPATTKMESDTWSFVYNMLAPMIEDMKPRKLSEWLRSEGFQIFIEKYLGGSNRLVVSDQDGHITFNDTIWHTKVGGQLDGVRLSNTYAWADIDKNSGKWGQAAYNKANAWNTPFYDKDEVTTGSSGVKVKAWYEESPYNYKLVDNALVKTNATNKSNVDAYVHGNSYDDFDDEALNKYDEDLDYWNTGVTTSESKVQDYCAELAMMTKKTVEDEVFQNPMECAHVLYHLLNN